MIPKPRVLIVGATGSSHIGGSLLRAAHDLGYEAQIADAGRAWRLGTVRQKLLWYWDRRPIHLESFSREVTTRCAEMRADLIIATGGVPITSEALLLCRSLGARVANFSTDDPFNPRHQARWFLDALKNYDIIFTPRRSNIEEFRRHGVRRVEYLRFGYDPSLFYRPESVSTGSASDLFFAGTADSDRVPYIEAALAANISVRLHGIYWDRYASTRQAARGQADIPTLRDAIAITKVALCLVRHENRDGHSMRTFEVPAVGACMVVEDTTEHREIFGEEGKNVVYFSSPREMVERAKNLLGEPTERIRLSEAAHRHIVNGRNTYADRLKTMLETAL